MSRVSRLSSEFTRLVLYRALQCRWHRLAFNRLEEFQKYELAPLEAVQKLQWKKLGDLLQHVAEYVPYYRSLFREEGIRPVGIRTPDDFARIPILRKDAITAAGRNMLAENIAPRDLRDNASGGSTGKPLHFYQDQRYWDWAQASQWFVESWWGIRPGDPTASIWGNDRDLPKLDWKERLWTSICQIRVCNAFALTRERLEGFARMLNSWQPRFVIGYSSALALFARFINNSPDIRIRPHAVKSTAEVLSAEDRQIIEAAFRCPVYNFYGSREVNNLAAECAVRKGLHVNALGRFIEVVDGAGRPVGPGVLGRIVVTDLTNYAMPFIRYEIEDIGAWSAAPCACGRPFPLLANVLGRKSDFIVTPSGKLIHGEYFTHLFYGMPGVSQFQLIQDSLDHVRMQVVLRPAAGEASINSLHNRLTESMGPGVRCDVEAVQQIERPSNGKHRFTISSVAIPWGHMDEKVGAVGAAGERP